ncbi:MAG: helix-turn-helix transcriptional regulator [Bacteroidota bacterium]
MKASVKNYAPILCEGVLDELIGMQVRLLRRSQHITQIQLAKGLNVTYQQVQKYERGRNRISSSTLLCIAAILDRPISEFFMLAEAYIAIERQLPT